MDNDTYDDRHSRQQICNKNIVKRLEELEDYQAQTIKKLEKLEDVVKQQSNLIDRTTTLIDNMAESMLNHLMAEKSIETDKDREYSYIEDQFPPF